MTLVVRRKNVKSAVILTAILAIESFNENFMIICWNWKFSYATLMQHNYYLYSYIRIHDNLTYRQ